MPYELFLALRYLRARRGRRVARWTALAAVAGIACGVAALTVATALANGFRDELRDKILRGTAHVTLAREGGAVEEPRAAGARGGRGGGPGSRGRARARCRGRARRSAYDLRGRAGCGAGRHGLHAP